MCFNETKSEVLTSVSPGLKVNIAEDVLKKFKSSSNTEVYSAVVLEASENKPKLVEKCNTYMMQEDDSTAKKAVTGGGRPVRARAQRTFFDEEFQSDSEEDTVVAKKLRIKSNNKDSKKQEKQQIEKAQIKQAKSLLDQIKNQQTHKMVALEKPACMECQSNHEICNKLQIKNEELTKKLKKKDEEMKVVVAERDLILLERDNAITEKRDIEMQLKDQINFNTSLTRLHKLVAKAEIVTNYLNLKQAEIDIENIRNKEDCSSSRTSHPQDAYKKSEVLDMASYSMNVAHDFLSPVLLKFSNANNNSSVTTSAEVHREKQETLISENQYSCDDDDDEELFTHTRELRDSITPENAPLTNQIPGSSAQTDPDDPRCQLRHTNSDLKVTELVAGSSVYVDASTLAKCASGTTASIIVRNLIPAVFTEEALLSNRTCRGSNKGQKKTNKDSAQALYQVAINGIYDFACKKAAEKNWPSFTEQNFTQSVNGFLSRKRKGNRITNLD